MTLAELLALPPWAVATVDEFLTYAEGVMFPKG